MENDAIQASKIEEEKKPEVEQFTTSLSLPKLIDTAMSNIMLKQTSIVSTRKDASPPIETEEDEKESRQPL